jgi:hypothetical protein
VYASRFSRERVLWYKEKELKNKKMEIILMRPKGQNMEYSGIILEPDYVINLFRRTKIV